MQLKVQSKLSIEILWVIITQDRTILLTAHTTDKNEKVDSLHVPVIKFIG